MKVTDVKFYKSKKGGNTVGIASITFDSEFVVDNIAVIEGKNGRFISFPKRKGKDKNGSEKYFDVAFPISAEKRKEITDVVLAKVEESETPATPDPAPAAASGEPAPEEEDPFGGEW